MPNSAASHGQDRLAGTSRAVPSADAVGEINAHRQRFQQGETTLLIECSLFEHYIHIATRNRRHSALLM